MLVHWGSRILFLWLISFGLCGYLSQFWVKVTFGFSRSSRLRKSCFQLRSMESCQRYPWAWLVLVYLRIVELSDDWYSVGNFDYGTLSNLQMDLIQLVRMPMWITLYWTKEACGKRMNGIKFFSKDLAEHIPCTTTNIKVLLLFLLVSWELLKISIRRGECSDSNNYLGISSLVKGVI